MLAMAVSVSCSDSDDDGGIDPNWVATETVTMNDGDELGGIIYLNNVLLTEGTYTLTDKLFVKSGCTLTIEPGVVIVADAEATGESSIVTADKYRYILIEQGAKIVAEGTAAKPILMTSMYPYHGAWGGLHICGKAPINDGSGTPQTAFSEVGQMLYGGADSNDSSGSLKHVVVSYTGQSLSESQECNGISFYGVGRGTVVEDVAAYKGSDDGFEFFGGSVNIKRAIVIDCQDDSFDWTSGWVGYGQFLAAYHSDDQNDCLLECDNHGTHYDYDPHSNPVLSNLTLRGKDHESSSSKNVGVMLKAGTYVQLYNAIVDGKTNSIWTKTTETDDALDNEISTIASVLISATSIGTSVSSAKYDYSSFTSGSNNAGGESFTYESNGYQNEAVVATAVDPTTLGYGDFFETANYVGAFNGTDWASHLVAIADADYTSMQ